MYPISMTQGEKSVIQKDKHTNQPLTTVRMNNTEVTMLADTGAMVSVMSISHWNQLKTKPTLQPVKVTLTPCGDHKIICHSKFEATIKSGSTSCKETIYVIPDNQLKTPILSYHASTALGIIKFMGHISQYTKGDFESDLSNPGNMSALLTKYDHLFKGIGCHNTKQITLHIDPDIKPVIAPQREVPIHLKDKFEQILTDIQSQDIIEDVEGPVEWISNPVLAPKEKPGEIPFTVDMFNANKAIQRTRKVIPTIEEVKAVFRGALVFSKIDMNSSYFQFPISEESRAIKTFRTPTGLKRFKRTTMGMNSAGEEVDAIIRRLLKIFLA